MNLEPKKYDEMDKSITVKTLIAFIAAIGIPVLVFLYTLSLQADRNELRSKNNSNSLTIIKNDLKYNHQDSERNFEKILEKLHDIDIKLQNKANRK